MEKINGLILKNLLESGAHNLSNQRKAVDAMNVFPVPDGDTGTNMSLTILNGISEVSKSGSESLSTVAKIFSRGLLMGARGNSGVILSQIFRGFAQYAKDKEELTVEEFSEALVNGSKMAYKAVMRPTEGTILTVVRESAEYGEIYINNHPETSIEEFVNYIKSHMSEFQEEYGKGAFPNRWSEKDLSLYIDSALLEAKIMSLTPPEGYPNAPYYNTPEELTRLYEAGKLDKKLNPLTPVMYRDSFPEDLRQKILSYAKEHNIKD